MTTMSLAGECICCGCHALSSSPAVLMPFVAKRVFNHDPIEITADLGLRDLRPGNAYTLCNSMQCPDCGALFLDYRFGERQMAALYTGYRDDTYTQLRDHYEPGYASATAQDYNHRHPYITDVEAWLATYLPNQPAVLDWGGGDGINTPFLETGLAHVHDISGVEVVVGAQRIERERIRENHYDLVVCSQVLEHVPSPLELILEIVPTLSQDTLFYIEVPHEPLVREFPGDLSLATRKRHWHEHINFFTEAALHRLLERAGLQHIETQLLSYDNGSRRGEVIGILARLSS